MCRPALDMFDRRPVSMSAYLSNYGWHFSKGLCEFAVSLMYSEDKDGKKVYAKCKKKDEIHELLTKHGIKMDKPLDYDFVYLFHMYSTDLKGTEDDEKKLLMIAKAIWCDVDVADGVTLRRWLATMTGNGEPVYWSDFLYDSE